MCPYFIGHGIGSHFHCYPEIWHHGKFRSGSRSKLLCDMKQREHVSIFIRIFIFSVFSANDNDMTMDEGMAFTIGELPTKMFAIRSHRA